jgi:hypothetical protein
MRMDKDHHKYLQNSQCCVRVLLTTLPIQWANETVNGMILEPTISQEQNVRMSPRMHALSLCGYYLIV